MLITDASCYSTTDIFAAGFQDHKIGPILGTDNNTGAGGANVSTLEQIRQLFASAGMTPPLQQLPKGASMRVAIRRTLRVGDEAGTELEDLGVRPDFEHQLTREDTLNGNPDLIAHAASLLIGKPVRVFSTKVLHSTWTSNGPPRRIGSKATIEVATAGVDYVDVFVDGRPRYSLNVPSTGALQFELPEPEREDSTLLRPVDVELRGYAASQLVCYRRLPSATFVLR